jgi:histidine triad (HIT) family protein
VFAFLDINPITPGHTLIIPKQQIDHLWDVDNELYLHLMEVSKLVAERIREVIKPERVGMQVMGFDVSHAHIHVFPLYEGVEETMTEHFNSTTRPSSEELDAMAKTLAF